MTQRDAKSHLRDPLSKLRSFLDEQYCSGQIHYEGDVVALTVQYLRGISRRCDPWWCFGTQHKFLGISPDIACYHSGFTHLPPDFRTGKTVNPKYLIGVIEVKFGNWGHDLQKLCELQEALNHNEGERPLGWMIYGDHFNREIHQDNCLKQLEREEQMLRWCREDKQTRGVTILKCGLHRKAENRQQYETRETLNRISWILDARSKYRK